MIALWWRDHNGGTGQVIDLSLYEPLFSLLGIQTPVYDQLGFIQERVGNTLPFSAPRNTYKSADGRWLAISGTSQSIAERIMRIVGHPEICDEPWFKDQTGRVANSAVLDELISKWIVEHTSEEAIRIFREGDAVIAPIYSIVDCLQDPQFIARETVIKVDHPKLGPVQIPAPVPKLSATPGRVRHLGADLGSDNQDILVDHLNLTQEQLSEIQTGWMKKKSVDTNQSLLHRPQGKTREILD
jgi:crotonobetainyl-CoA:carnitine CoA-transferase CaiB-like acyl-CoA transferase